MVWFLKICAFNILLYWAYFLFHLFLSLAYSTSVLSIPIFLFIILCILWNNLLQVFWTTFFKNQLQNPLICQTYLKFSRNDNGFQSCLHSLLILLIPGLKLIYPGEAPESVYMGASSVPMTCLYACLSFLSVGN